MLLSASLLYPLAPAAPALLRVLTWDAPSHFVVYHPCCWNAGDRRGGALVFAPRCAPTPGAAPGMHQVRTRRRVRAFTRETMESGGGRGAHSVTPRGPGPGPVPRGVRVAVAFSAQGGRAASRRGLWTDEARTGQPVSLAIPVGGGWGAAPLPLRYRRRSPRRRRSLKAEASGSSPLTC